MARKTETFTTSSNCSTVRDRSFSCFNSVDRRRFGKTNGRRPGRTAAAT
jgi:hypothetical protein